MSEAEGTTGAHGSDLSAQRFEITTSRQFTSWLAESVGSIALTTYQSGKIILIGCNAKTKRLSIFERTLERPMGMAFDGRRMAVAALVQIVTFVNAMEAVTTTNVGYDATFVRQMAHYTADLDAHDLAYDANGRLIFVNTLFSCLAAVSDTHSFRHGAVLHRCRNGMSRSVAGWKALREPPQTVEVEQVDAAPLAPHWQPPFITRLAAEDRCHLNGLAMRNGIAAYVTAVAETDVADGWRDNRASGGVVVDVASNEIVCCGLSMPHSPRLHGGKLWVLNSRTGEIGVIEPKSGTFEPVAFCPGARSRLHWRLCACRSLGAAREQDPCRAAVARSLGKGEGCAALRRLHSRYPQRLCGALAPHRGRG